MSDPSSADIPRADIPGADVRGCDVGGADVNGDGTRTTFVRLVLDLQTFDPTRFSAPPHALTITSYAAAGDSAANRRRLWELNRTCAADIPHRGEFYGFEEYVDARIERSFEAEGTILALDGEQWVGLCQLSRRDGEAYAQMTGLLRPYRGRGLSLALKLPVLAVARRWGVRWVRTQHHPGSTAAIATNRRLGFVDDPGPQVSG